MALPQDISPINSEVMDTLMKAEDVPWIPQPLDPEKVKFFFNYMEFTENELENMLEAHQTESDGWVAVEVPPELVLSSDYDRGDAWARLRNAINKF